MAPGLSSVPPSASPGTLTPAESTANGADPAMSDRRPASPTGSPRSLSVSLQAAATTNAGLQYDAPTRSPGGANRHSPSTGRRRSAVLLNLQHNDPSLPGPGEMASDGHPQGSRASPRTGSPMLTSRDAHHNRAPSLGELHQELEAEQEAQVNRLLSTIRQQQLQIQQAQASQGADESAVLSDASGQGQSLNHQSHASVIPSPRSPGAARQPRSSFDLARADIQRRSRTPSRGASPRLRSTSISGDSDHLNLRDESALYQAETQMLVRENQMLRHRIRDLERQLSEANIGGDCPQSHANEPILHSNLTRSVSLENDTAPGPSVAQRAAESTGQVKP